MDLDKLRELVRIFENAHIAEMEIEEEDGRIVLKKAAVMPSTGASLSSMASAPSPVAQAQSQVMAAPPAPKASLEPSGGDDLDGLALITSPMVGVFYVAPAPGEPPFVSVGDEVEADQTVCIVEAMKLMNEVSAKYPCVVEKVLVENAEPVEYGQPLFAVRPLEQD